jgi:hypothetical protein
MKKIKFLVSFWNGTSTERKEVVIIDTQSQREQKKIGMRSKYLAEKIKEQTGFNHVSYSQIA